MEKKATNLQKFDKNKIYRTVKHIVLLAKLCGVLPVAFEFPNLKNNHHLWSISISRSGLLIVTVYLASLTLLTQSLFVGFDSWIFFIRPTHLAVTDGLFTIQCCLLCFLTIFYRTKPIIRIINTAISLIFHSKSKSTFNDLCLIAMTYFIVVFGSLSSLIRVVVESSKMFSIILALVNLQETAVVFILVLILSSVSMLLESINNDLECLIKTDHGQSSPRLICTLNRFTSQHRQACELFHGLALCCSLDLVTICCFSLLKIVFMLYTSYTIVREKITGSTHYVTLAEVSNRFFVICYLGWLCDRITLEISVFQLYLASKSTEFSVCGLFRLRRASFYTMLKMTGVYLVVLIQLHGFA